MRMPTRLRRKCVRFSGGRASRRRIRSRSARSLSFLRASSRAFLLTRGFFKHLLQNGKHGEFAWTAGRLLALDDISKSSHQNSPIAEPHFQGALLQSTPPPPGPAPALHTVAMSRTMALMDALDRRSFCRTLALGAAGLRAGRSAAVQPNIVYVLADDLGWGDLRCYNPKSAVPTPNADRLATQGVRFTDMHAPSAVCTPSRYGILTGRYCWRTRLKQGVLNGYDPDLIEPGRLTVPAMLRSRGYYTAGIGKWHLGLGDRPKTDYAQPLRPGPIDHGFDDYFGIPASLDMEPYLYFHNDRPVEQPTARTEGSNAPRGVFWRAGARAPGFQLPEVLPTITRRAVDTHRRACETTREALLPLPGVDGAAHAMAAVTRIPRQIAGGRLRRFRRPGGRHGGAGDARPGPDGPGRQHAADLDQRQWRRLEGGRQGALRPPGECGLARREGGYLGRRAPHSVPRPLARPYRPRLHQRGTGVPDRPDGDAGGGGRLPSSGKRRRGYLQPAAGDAG